MTALNKGTEAVPEKSLVLVVDDQPKNLQLAASVLSPYYRLLLADSGQKALNIAAEKQPDLILLDVMMPGLSGYEVCGKLKENEATRDIPVIFLTAKTEVEDIMQAFEVGAVDYVTKPFKAKEVLARLKTQISLRQSEKLLKQHNAFKDRLFSIIGHDLLGPLGSIYNLMEMIRENQETFEKQQVLSYCHMVQESSSHTIDLLNNLLEWSRSQLQHHRAEVQPVVVAAELQQVLSQLGQLAVNKGIRFEEQVPADLQVKANANMLQTILRNLVSNSIKFTASGTHITITASRQNGVVEFAVADQGLGIKPEIVQRILSKTNSSTSFGTNNEKGSGLGLNLCVNFIEQLGGKLRIDSEPGKGSTFRFTLPAVS